MHVTYWTLIFLIAVVMKGTKVQTLSAVHTLYIPWHSYRRNVKIESDSTVYVTGGRPSSPWIYRIVLYF